MVLEKKPLSFADIEAQTALELPDRETLQTVIIGCLALCVGQITIRDVTVDVVRSQRWNRPSFFHMPARRWRQRLFRSIKGRAWLHRSCSIAPCIHRLS